MLSSKELIDEIDEELNTCDCSRDVLLRSLNKAVLAVSGTADLYLPELLISKVTISTFTGQYYRPLPSNFHKKVTSVYSGSSPVRVYSSVAELRQVYGDLGLSESSITGVATQGSRIYYQGVPTEATDIIISYYKKPEVLIDDGNNYPEGVSGCHEFEECLKNFVLWKEWKKIEDGLEGQMSNTAYYKNEYFENLEMLKDFCTRDIGPNTTEPASAPYQLFNE